MRIRFVTDQIGTNRGFVANFTISRQYNHCFHSAQCFRPVKAEASRVGGKTREWTVGSAGLIYWSLYVLVSLSVCSPIK